MRLRYCSLSPNGLQYEEMPKGMWGLVNGVTFWEVEGSEMQDILEPCPFFLVRGQQLGCVESAVQDIAHSLDTILALHFTQLATRRSPRRNCHL